MIYADCKVGDRVRLNDASPGDIKKGVRVGEAGTITGFVASMRMLNVTWDGGSSTIKLAGRVDLIERLK